MADFRLGLLRKGRLAEFTTKLPGVYARSTTRVLKRKAKALKNAIRRDIVKAGLGARLRNTIRDQVFPRRGFSMRARGRVFSRAIVKRRGRSFDLITLFDQGALIRPRSAKFLAIPTEAAGARRSPRQWPRGSLFLR